MLDNKEMLMKVASYDKATCIVANAVINFKDALKKQAAEARKQEVQTKVASIVDGVLNKKAIDKKAVVLDIVNKAINK